MFGYMSLKQAQKHGFTHHGSYYKIPLWIAPEKDFMVATKWAPMEYLMSFIHVVENTLHLLFTPQKQGTYRFLLGSEISVTKK